MRVGPVPDPGRWGTSRAGNLMPATALQTFKAQFFRALSHPVRIKILEILISGDRSVQELQEALNWISPSCRSSSPCCVIRAS